jgi:hypothetical protein
VLNAPGPRRICAMLVPQPPAAGGKTLRHGPAEYFDIEVLHGQIVLAPMRIQRGDAVRAKLAALGLTDADVADGPCIKR